ncbi:hypothetical protein [Aureimonas sp. ME7]|uniref:hypothetical protein n=1 Tax=Aureimonas sp. ME7 TaxID=2744252 RepID=UPI0015F6424A|nr:hypothetical protein [Aureimonas sp. ME7]
MRARTLLLLLPLLSGCTAVDGPAFSERGPAYDPPIGVVPDFYRKPVSRTCENYADQTARNSFENLSDGEDSFGVSALNRTRAEREGDRAYQRCREGRLS